MLFTQQVRQNDIFLPHEKSTYILIIEKQWPNPHISLINTLKIVNALADCNCYSDIKSNWDDKKGQGNIWMVIFAISFVLFSHRYKPSEFIIWI